MCDVPSAPIRMEYRICHKSYLIQPNKSKLLLLPSSIGNKCGGSSKEPNRNFILLARPSPAIPASSSYQPAASLLPPSPCPISRPSHHHSLPRRRPAASPHPAATACDAREAHTEKSTQRWTLRNRNSSPPPPPPPSAANHSVASPTPDSSFLFLRREVRAG
jgi:hypothetical protein